MPKIGLLRPSRILQVALALATVPIVFAQPAVSGRVMGENSVGIPSVTVVLQSLREPASVRQTYTDREGRYAFGEVENGEYFLEASYDGFVGVRLSPIRVRFPLKVHKDFVLQVAPGQEGGVQNEAEVSGELKWKGQRLAHARVCLRRVPSVDRCTQTNGLGQYSLVVEPGSYEVIISVGAEVLWTSRVDVPAAGFYLDRIQLQPN
jgi:hypothetical protein